MSPTGLNPQAFEHFVNGDLYELSRDLRSAIQEYEKAKALEPDVPEIRYALARVYLMIKDAEAAKREALQIEPKDGKVYRLLGDCYRGTGAVDSATEAYTKAVELDSAAEAGHGQVHLLLDKARLLATVFRQDSPAIGRSPATESEVR
jgi:cytochrome c-type biogenesis protein CcmH/NrfG